MGISISLIVSSVLLGVGLAMDAFSVSLANGLNEPQMKAGKMMGVSGTYALFQWFMPMAGWVLVHTAASFFQVFEKMIPWIAFLLLAYIGGKMVAEAIRDEKKKKESGEESEEAQTKKLGFGMLMMQGVATSIDALSVGFTTAEYGWQEAMVSSVIIGLVTWLITFPGLAIGKKFGTRLAGKATLVGGLILIAIGLKILIESFLK